MVADPYEIAVRTRMRASNRAIMASLTELATAQFVARYCVDGRDYVALTRWDEVVPPEAKRYWGTPEFPGPTSAPGADSTSISTADPVLNHGTNPGVSRERETADRETEISSSSSSADSAALVREQSAATAAATADVQSALDAALSAPDTSAVGADETAPTSARGADPVLTPERGAPEPATAGPAALATEPRVQPVLAYADWIRARSAPSTTVLAVLAVVSHAESLYGWLDWSALTSALMGYLKANGRRPKDGAGTLRRWVLAEKDITSYVLPQSPTPPRDAPAEAEAVAEVDQTEIDRLLAAAAAEREERQSRDRAARGRDCPGG